MAKPVKMTETILAQRSAEGRGTGIGQDYVPFHLVSDFSSLGDSRRVFSFKTGRVHHLMSTIEWHIFLLLEHDKDVKDIREQYPLKREETLSIAAELCIRHPTYPLTQVPCVMTVDFLVTRQRGNTRTLGMIDAKSTEEAENVRSMEKLEITRTLADSLGVSHDLVFGSMLPQNKVRFLEWIRAAALTPEEISEHGELFALHKERLLYDLVNHQRSGSIAAYCEQYDVRTGSPTGTGLRTVRLLLQEHQLVTDLNQPNPSSTPVAMLKPQPTPGLRLASGG